MLLASYKGFTYEEQAFSYLYQSNLAVFFLYTKQHAKLKLSLSPSKKKVSLQCLKPITPSSLAYIQQLRTLFSKALNKRSCKPHNATNPRQQKRQKEKVPTPRVLRIRNKGRESVYAYSRSAGNNPVVVGGYVKSEVAMLKYVVLWNVIVDVCLSLI